MPRLRRRFVPPVACGALLTALLLLSPATAWSQGYPPASAELAVSASVVVPGGLVTVSGDGFAAGATITITFESTPVVIGVVQADASGRFTTQVRVPVDAPPGVHTIRATGAAAGGGTRVLTARVTVAAPGPAGAAASPPPVGAAASPGPAGAGLAAAPTGGGPAAPVARMVWTP
ncbi:MAG TPA: hypothetical protein VHH09_06095, partial [Acidimicrobiales bacterium]|nr:hypothetical protein [Acidimicrobiales bacterium]